MIVKLLFFSSVIKTALNCYQCFIDVDDSLRLCWGHILTEYNIRNVDSCFNTLDRIFNNESRVIEAGKVGRGYDVMLKNILMTEIMPIVEEFDQQKNNDTVYEFRLQAAANNFIAAASRLPRASGCFPPCGFQAQGAVYNCMTCQYDSCEFPLDCPVKEIKVKENNRTQMWCKVPFLLPTDAEIVWRYAMERTMLMDRFDEVTAGVDPLYFIPSARPEHSGTYQCEIFSQEHSLVRIYYYLTVVPMAQIGHAELQDIFEQALLPGGQFPPLSHTVPFTLWLPSPALVTICLTAMLLLIFLSLGALYWLSYQIGTDDSDPAQETKFTEKKKYVIHC
ncbi:Sperm acrosome membrane-associated protein 6 [Labeo rohita]|uniref:Sperm acrosome membrane-associated protein 6 n=2 Tax=Labeo rohita TaxID=84645 RepID=A0ABQ8LX84_LABRO|nr:sperm acrosome associated 6 [Labeo rohita]KAI2655251.1 Sperm acrosome membrane-associated protein 6 [Labeo rohita]